MGINAGKEADNKEGEEGGPEFQEEVTLGRAAEGGHREEEEDRDFAGIRAREILLLRRRRLLRETGRYLETLRVSK